MQGVFDMEKSNMRQKANSLAEATHDKPFYESRESLISEMAKEILRFSAFELIEEKPCKLFIGCMEHINKNFSNHDVLIYASLGFPPDIEYTVDAFIDYAHNGNFGRMRFGCGYTAKIHLIQDETFEGAYDFVSSSMYFDKKDMDSLKSMISPRADCSECGGTGQYVGLNFVEPCCVCDGGK